MDDPNKDNGMGEGTDSGGTGGDTEETGTETA